MDVGHRKHGSAHQHTEQGAVGRPEPGHVDEQPVLRVQAQCYHQDRPDDVDQGLASELACKIRNHHRHENKLTLQ